MKNYEEKMEQIKEEAKVSVVHTIKQKAGSVWDAVEKKGVVVFGLKEKVSTNMA